MAGTLKSQMTPESVANDIIMQWKSPGVANKVLVLVEGKDDRTFYFKFFNQSTAEIKYCNGCRKVTLIHQHLQRNAKFKNIAIKDSDFERLNGNPPSSHNLFYADGHDYEMMCLKNANTRKKLFDNLATPYDENLIEEIFSDLNYLSYFKWYNYTHHCNYNFKTFKVIDKSFEDLSLFSRIHAQILPFSPKCQQINEEDLELFIVSRKECDIYELTNGHDFINRLCHYLKEKQIIGSNESNEKSIKNTLHPCYDIIEFAKSDLYHNINVWESKNDVSILNPINN